MLFPLKLLHYHHLRWRVALSHQKPFNIHVVCVSLRSNKSHLIIGRPEEQRMPFTAAYQINQQWCAPWMKRFNKRTFVCHWTVRKFFSILHTFWYIHSTYIGMIVSELRQFIKYTNATRTSPVNDGMPNSVRDEQTEKKQLHVNAFFKCKCENFVCVCRNVGRESRKSELVNERRIYSFYSEFWWDTDDNDDWQSMRITNDVHFRIRRQHCTDYKTVSWKSSQNMNTRLSLALIRILYSDTLWFANICTLRI